ncbi:recombinase family protein [Peribacillus sp. TH27]|uniref:recombinase family protein n=1 Tax=Peribacillus sp. TH27 TaxID=2798484 RepID=UPI0019118924|nr:recombinase family protein [Peribacillus sp. TH27]
MSNTIKTILSNPHYIGNLAQCRTTTISVVSTKRKSIDTNEQKIVEGTHEPIIMKMSLRLHKNKWYKEKRI